MTRPYGRVRSRQILELLADATEPMSSAQLAHAAGLLPRAMPVNQAQTRINGALTYQQKRGLVEQSGRVYWQKDGQRKRHPSTGWRITEAGREVLAGASDREQLAIAHHAAAMIRNAARDAALEQACRAISELSMTPPVRRRIALELHSHGVSLRRIGGLFGVTGQQIHYDIQEGRYGE